MSEQGGAEREREGDRVSSRLCSASTKPHEGLEHTNCEIKT